MKAFWRKDNFQVKNMIPFLELLLANGLTQWTSHKGRIRNPVIILGCGRSGTSILKEVLSSHKSLATYPFEANELWHPRYYPWHESAMDIAPFWYDPKAFSLHTQRQMSEKDEHALLASFGNFQSLTGKKHLLLKSAMVSFMIPRLLELIPDLRFIHLVRDGRAVALSYAKKQQRLASDKSDLYGSSEYDLSFDDLLLSCSQLWQDTIDDMIVHDSNLDLTGSGRMLTVRYEDFCKSPEQLANEIYQWMGLPGNPFGKKTYPSVSSMNSGVENNLDPKYADIMLSKMSSGLAFHGYLA
ncbi:MAG: sulfotransferase [Flavobacteriales bacterium]|nr:sulfotransferase [Flavobacteriales bacterium]